MAITAKRAEKLSLWKAWNSSPQVRREDRAVIRQLEFPGFARVATVKRASFIPEESLYRRICGQGCAVSFKTPCGSEATMYESARATFLFQSRSHPSSENWHVHPFAN